MNRKSIFLLLILIFLTCFLSAAAEGETPILSITTNYSSTDGHEYQITVDYSDDWLLGADSVYDHRLAQASFGLVVSGFRDRTEDLYHKDDNVLGFLADAGFENIRTDDFDHPTSSETIATAIAHKKIGDVTVIVVCISGNVYENEWLNNLTIDDGTRAVGFNQAAKKVMARIESYLGTVKPEGSLHLWITGYSRSAAVANITAADATDSRLFEAVYAYTFATPRTTKDEDAEKYSNIFNIINPFDPVPKVPFPEWGYVRYGTDLFLTSWETDGTYLLKKINADRVFQSFKGEELPYNPQINAEVQTLMDFMLFFISSNRSYRDTFQKGILDFWVNRKVNTLVKNIFARVLQLSEIRDYQLREFGNFLDYAMQVGYTVFRGKFFHPDDVLWNRNLSIKDNLMHEHFDEVYRCWLFASDDPDEIFYNDPRDIHFVVHGDVDIEVFDRNQDLVGILFSDGRISRDISDVEFHENEQGLSDSQIYMNRRDGQSILILPQDQVYTIVILQNADETVTYSYVQFDGRKLQGEVQYIVSEQAAPDQVLWIDTETLIQDYNEEDLFELGFRMVEPWSNEIVYSPAGVMHLENQDIFHPSPLIFVTISLLILILILFIFIQILIGTGKGITLGVKTIHRQLENRKKEQVSDNKGKIEEADGIPGSDTSDADIVPSHSDTPEEDSISNHSDAPEEDILQDIQYIKDTDHENQ